MKTLHIPLAMVSDAGLAISQSVSEAAVRPAGARELDISEASVAGDLTRAGNDYLFTGRVSGTYQRACDRCLEAVAVAVSAEVAWTFVHGGVEDFFGETLEAGFQEGGVSAVPDDRPIVGEQIDLATCMWEELVLAAPSKVVCRPACRGLCPVCGANLNEQTCAHAGLAEEESGRADAHRGFARLAELYPELTNKEPKE